MTNTNIRKFALVIVDDFDVELERIPLDYVDMPKNLGFELEFTTLETRLTTYFTSAREKKIPITLNVYFLNPNAYTKANTFKSKVQANINKRMLLEYNDTTETKYWEGKIQKFQQDELDQFKTLICPISFLPGTPKYRLRNNVITIQQSANGKAYPYKYPYSYGRALVEHNTIVNTYFDDVPLRITIYGSMSNPEIGLLDEDAGKIYSTIRFENLYVAEGEELIIDSITSKVLIKRNGVLMSAYDYLSKDSNLDTFLYAKANTTSKIVINLDPSETGYLKASYHQ